jgi:hypothetical protein
MRKLRHDRVEMALVGPLADSVYQGGSRHICSLSRLNLIRGDYALIEKSPRILLGAPAEPRSSSGREMPTVRSRPCLRDVVPTVGIAIPLQCGSANSGRLMGGEFVEWADDSITGAVSFP